MVTALSCTAILFVAVVVGLVVGFLIVHLQQVRSLQNVALYDITPDWYVELWDIAQGISMRMRFYGALTLGRGYPGKYYGNNFGVGTASTISREHCVLYEQNGALLLWNLSQTNPTLLNGGRMEHPEVLMEGDHIAIGENVYLVTAISYVE